MADTAERILSTGRPVRQAEVPLFWQPLRPHGWQGREGAIGVISADHGATLAGSPGPKTEMTGVPQTAARCPIPESVAMTHVAARTALTMRSNGAPMWSSGRP